MKRIIKAILESIIGLATGGLLLFSTYQGLREMILEGEGWYDHSDYLFTIILILVLWVIAYVQFKFVWLTWKKYSLEKANEALTNALCTALPMLTDDKLAEFQQEIRGE